MSSVGTHSHNSLEKGLLILGAALLPIKLSLAYAALIPLILYTIYRTTRDSKALYNPQFQLAVPMFLFFIVALFEAPFGINIATSVTGIFSALFMAIMLGSYASPQSRTLIIPIIGALCISQSIAAFHSILSATLPEPLAELTVGPVTESGQLALVLPALAGMLLSLRFTYPQMRVLRGLGLPETFPERKVVRLVGFILFLMLFAACSVQTLHSMVALSYGAIVIGGVTIMSCLIISLVALKKSVPSGQIWHFLGVTVFSPLLWCTLLFNLKRGPWAGVLCGMFIFLTASRRRFILPLIAFAIIVFAGVTPIRERLITSRDHFFISGGRSEIWDIGTELLTSYPLGIGFQNSPFLQEFSADIPPNLKHFHNNLINIAVETGWMGVLIFLWWCFLTLKASFSNFASRGDTALARGIGASFIAWQVAGTVEYNFGDSEVVLIAYVLIGLLAGLSIQSSGAHATRTNPLDSLE